MMAALLAFAMTTLFLVTPLYIIYKPPALLIRHLQVRWPDVLFHHPTATKTIALTIDDGPSEHTAEIAQLLAANDSTATFFVIGSHVAGREAVLRDLVHAGCELGNHAMRDEPSRGLSKPELVQQIGEVEGMLKEVYEAVGADGPPKCFRPGSGFFSARMRDLLRNLGYRLVLGDIYPHDPQVPFWRLNARHVLSMLQPGGIIVCHDGRSWTLPMLRRVLPEIRRRGYRVVNVTQLLQETTM